MPGLSPTASSFVCTHEVLRFPEYLFELDEHALAGQQFFVAHIRVWRFSPSVFKHILRNWRTFRECVRAPVFAIGEVDDEKWRRFVALLGFEPALEVVCNNGARRLMYRSLCPKLNDALHAETLNITAGKI